MKISTISHQKMIKLLFQRRFLSDSIKSSLEKTIKSHEIVVFMKGTKEAPQCGFSKAVCQVMELSNKDFKDINVLKDDEIREGIKEFTNWPTIPQVFIKGEFVGGCDIIVDLFKSNELDKLFNKDGI
jgi:monothiol glutaredoxin